MRCGSRSADHSQSPNVITAPSSTAAPMAAPNMRLIIAILPRMKRSGLAGVALLAVLAAAAPTAQPRITAPKEAFGFALGDDYHLANYKQIADYWRRLDKQSDRLLVEEIGKTAEGRPQLMAIVTSPANHKRLAHYKTIARRLALAEGLTDEQARA